MGQRFCLITLPVMPVLLAWRPRFEQAGSKEWRGITWTVDVQHRDLWGRGAPPSSSRPPHPQAETGPPSSHTRHV